MDVSGLAGFIQQLLPDNQSDFTSSYIVTVFIIRNHNIIYTIQYIFIQQLLPDNQSDFTSSYIVTVFIIRKANAIIHPTQLFHQKSSFCEEHTKTQMIHVIGNNDCTFKSVVDLSFKIVIIFSRDQSINFQAHPLI